MGCLLWVFWKPWTMKQWHRTVHRWLTNCGLMMLMMSGNWVTIGSCYDLLPVWHQAITSINVESLLIGSGAINFSEIEINIKRFSFQQSAFEHTCLCKVLTIMFQASMHEWVNAQLKEAPNYIAHYWPFVRGIHCLPMDSWHKGPLKWKISWHHHDAPELWILKNVIYTTNGQDSR